MKIGVTIQRLSMPFTFAADRGPVYSICYGISDLSTAAGRALTSIGRNLLAAVDSSERTWPDLGVWLIAPTEVEAIAFFRVEIWELRSEFADVGALLQKASASIHYNHPMVRAIGDGHEDGVKQEVEWIADRVGDRLRAQNAEFWAGTSVAIDLRARNEIPREIAIDLQGISVRLGIVATQ